MEKRTWITCTHSEIERIIAKAYGIADFQFVAANDTSYTYSITKSELDSDEVERIVKLIAAQCAEEWEIHCIFTDLVNNDLLEEGDYLVMVSW